MPIYSYECPECKTGFDNFWKLEDYRNDTFCPKCGTLSVKQINRKAVCLRNDKGGFVSGYQPGLGMHVETRGQYKDILKKRGLVEMGNASSTQTFEAPRKKINDEILKAAVDGGAKFSGREADALKSGESLHVE